MAQDSRRKSISIYIDNSFSMGAEGKEGELLLTAKEKGREVIKNFKERDRFQVLTNDFEGRHQHLVSKEEAMQLIDEIKMSAANKTVKSVMARQAQALERNREDQKLAFIVSDFQKMNANVGFNDSSVSTVLIPLTANKQRNLAIDSCWFESPFVQHNSVNKFKVLIRNYSDEAIENASVNLKINGKQKAVGGFNVAPRATGEAELAFTVNEYGWQAGELSIVDHPITFDDHFYFGFEVARALNVYTINGGVSNTFITDVFATDEYFKMEQSSQRAIDYNKMKQANLLILDGITDYSSGLQLELEKYIERGGDVFINPSTDELANASANGFLAKYGVGFGPLTKVLIAADKVNMQSYIFKGAFEKLNQQTDFPMVNQYYQLKVGAQKAIEPLITMHNNDFLSVVTHTGKGNIYLSAVPFERAWSTFQHHALFVPFMYKMAMATQKTGSIFNRIGADKLVYVGKEIEAGQKGVKMQKDGYELMPDISHKNGITSLFVADMIKEAGNYRLLVDAAQAQNNPVIAFNYTSGEGNLECLEAEGLEKLAGKNIKVFSKQEKMIAAGLGELSLGTQFWRACLWLALLFILAEILLIKFWK
jgi:hypothetical protein